MGEATGKCGTVDFLNNWIRNPFGEEEGGGDQKWSNALILSDLRVLSFARGRGWKNRSNAPCLQLTLLAAPHIIGKRDEPVNFNAPYKVFC